MTGRTTQTMIQSAEATFREYLGDHGLKYTPPRRMVFEAVMANPEHFEAEQLLLDLRQAGHRVARATIYRTLPLLVSCGVLKAVRLGEKLVHYEQVYGAAPHDHMVCQKCGRIIEFDSRDIVKLRVILANQFKFHDIGHRFQITGLCRKCVEAQPADRRPFLASERSASARPQNKGTSSKGRRRS